MRKRLLSLFNREPRSISVPARLVPHLRSAILAAFGSAIAVLDAQLQRPEPDRRQWLAGLTQFDCARELLDTIGVTAGRNDRDLVLDLSPQPARLFLDALRGIYDTEVNRTRNAAAAHVEVPLRELPALRRYIIHAEQQLRGIAQPQPILPPPEKRTLRAVRHKR